MSAIWIAVIGASVTAFLNKFIGHSVPEKWLNKYSLLFKVGEGKADNLKLSKYHFSILDELYQQRDEEELIFQLEGKYEKIRERYAIADVAPPAHLLPTLRPYQISGFQWLNYLHDVQWGGILADDMGLGKTAAILATQVADQVYLMLSS